MKKILHILLYSCRKATELIEKRSMVGLSWSERIRLRMHKSLCDACTTYEKQSKLLDRILHKHIHTGEQPDIPTIQNGPLKDRIINRL